MSIKGIISGYSNLMFKKEEVEVIAKERRRLCNLCGKSEFGESRFCKKSNGGCGCYLPAKTRALDEYCPDKKWLQE